jgi:hypothetical protein
MYFPLRPAPALTLATLVKIVGIADIAREKGVNAECASKILTVMGDVKAI